MSLPAEYVARTGLELAGVKLWERGTSMRVLGGVSAEQQNVRTVAKKLQRKIQGAACGRFEVIFIAAVRIKRLATVRHSLTQAVWTYWLESMDDMHAYFGAQVKMSVRGISRYPEQHPPALSLKLESAAADG